MKGFSTPKTCQLEIKRGEESVTFDLQALPPGWAAWLRGQFPKPVIYKSGKPEPDPVRGACYDDWLVYIQIAKALESSGVLTAQAPNKPSAAAFEEYAKALEAEFRAANFTDSELLKVGLAVQKMNYSLADVEVEGND